MQTQTCGTCGKSFERNEKVGSNLAEALGRNSRSICYACALDEITRGRAPEEGDFNSALLISGEISDKDLRWLMEDLQAVEQGRSVRERFEPDDEEDADWCHVCMTYIRFCTCGLDEDEERQDDLV